MALQQVLVVDDEESLRWVLAKALGRHGLQVDLADCAAAALDRLQHKTYDLALLDIKMPDRSGLELLDDIRQQWPQLPVIIMTAESSMKNAIEAMKRGAYDYITKPFDLDMLEALLLKAQELVRTRHEVERLQSAVKEQQRSERTLIGTSQPMQEVYKLLGRVATSDITVLITGESGTGKELVARAVHQNSNRLGQPFVALNCAAIPRELLESELFGFEKGAFTGAAERKIGKFEQASGGTIFLDEIGDMPLELQAKLLRVLQEREISRMGGNRAIPINVRIVAATNQDLQQRVATREFREDLFYRLNVVPIQLPPLRQRPEDIPLLVDFFIQRANQEFHTHIHGCSAAALQGLQNFTWPGNVRELENTVQRACLLSQNQVLQLSDFPVLRDQSDPVEDDGLETLIANKLRSALLQKEIEEINDLYTMVLEQMERPLLRIVLEKTRGNQLRAAEVLGINRNTLRKKIRLLGLETGRNDGVTTEPT